MFIIVVYMNQVHSIHLKVIYVMVNKMIIWKPIVHLINLTSGVESEVTFVSSYASSKVISLTHVL